MLTIISYAQEKLASNKIPISAYDKKKATKIAAINIGLYGGSMIALYNAWYKNYPQSKFHTFNDISEWQQMDKIGHAFSAYTMSQYNMDLWRNAGLERKKRIWLGGLTGATYQTIIEVLDGFSSEWGWSWGDIAANIIGSSLFISQELAWDEQRISLKTSFHKKVYDDNELNKRSNDLFGKSLAERSLKDYNGQTYWLSANIHSFFPSLHSPKWLQISIGTGAEGMFGATENIAYDKNGLLTFDKPGIKRFRQWYLAPDINLTKIKTNKKGLKTAFYILNCLKFPTPTLEFYNSKIKFNWIHF